ncbi:MAG: DUF1361 domain-containing protein [Chitinophagaceae bacterium]|nr:DUF1361 domain-containing protein [Chitinophagaceae bacterium]
MQQWFYKQGNKDVFSFNQWLFISCSFSFLLLTGRVAATGSLTYVFLLWNLFLAFIPYGITCWLSGNIRVIENKAWLALALLLWLLFIPNSFYILTDLFHLRNIRSAPRWFDLLLLLSFAWNGLVLGIVSVRRAEIILEMVFSKSFSLFMLFVVMWLNALGIYIGRFLRYNSWDVVAQPFSLFMDMFDMILHPLASLSEWVMIACYALFMTLLYITVRKLSESFADRQH